MTDSIRKLTTEEIRSIFDSELPRSFPQSEIKPYSAISHGIEDGRYYGYGLFRESTLCCYALIFRHGEKALLDYLAVDPALRGNGLGQRMMRHLRDVEPGLLLEADDPSFAGSEAELNKRNRRLHFYFDVCSCTDTGLRTSAAGCPFVVLTLRDPVTSGEYLALYRAMIPELYEEYKVTIR